MGHSIVCTSTVEHPCERAVFKLGFEKCFKKKVIFCSNLSIFLFLIMWITSYLLSGGHYLSVHQILNHYSKV